VNAPLPPSGNTTAAAALAGERARANRTLLTRLLVVAVAMFGFGYALVPFYDQICEATGLRNLLQPDVVANSQVDATRTVRIEFDSNVRNLPWTFKPVAPTADVHPGQLQQIVYSVSNNTNRAITGQAIPSYGPQHAARYFQKLECFCFAKQTLQPGETRQMPVVFVIDPKIPDDLKTITLSYTFFEVEGADAGSMGNADDRQAPARPRA
jgi:cytochrome c oxidase assembly protein subunit 11